MSLDSTEDKVIDLAVDLNRLESVYQRLRIETKIKTGAENLLQVFDTFQKGDLASKREIVLQLDAANSNIAALTKEVEYYETLKNKPDNDQNGFEEAIEKHIESISSLNLDAQIRGINLKKFTLWLDQARPDLNNFELKIFHCLRQCLCDSSRELRALAIRAIRHVIALTKNLKPLLSFHFDFFTIRTMIIDSKWDCEKEQIILTLRTLLTIDDWPRFITDGIVRAIIAIAEQAEDKNRSQCVELLVELFVYKPEVVSRTGGMRTILHSLFELPYDITTSICQIMLSMLDKPSTRCYIRPNIDFEFIFSPLLDSNDKSSTHKEKLRTCSKIILCFLKNWNGIMYFCTNDLRTIRSIVDALNSNSEDTKRTMLEMFFQLFNLNMPNWNVTFSTLDLEDFGNPNSNQNSGPSLSLLDQHYAIVLHLLLEAGITERLTKLIECLDQYINFYAMVLISEIIKLSNRLMSRTSKNVENLQRLFGIATMYKNEDMRHLGLNAVLKVDRSNLSYLRYLNTNPTCNYKGYNQDKKQIERIKLRIGSQVDDEHFKSMLNDTQVLTDKDYNKWNWKTIMELLQGPLLSAKRLDETMKGAKFVKRLLTFYSPSSRQFSEIRYSKVNHLFVQVGCELLNTLLANSEGIKILTEHEILEQIRASLNELDPINRSLQSEHFFSKERMFSNLSPYYFTLLGVLSRYSLGIKVLEKFHIFDLYYHVCELRSRDDLVRAILSSLDYRRDGHARILLSKVLTSAYKHIRLFATNYLRVLLRKGLPGFNSWGIHLLITQLYDPTLEVCEMAVSVLEEACMDPENLNTLVKLKPNISHLGVAGDYLLLRYLSSTEGLSYLLAMDYVEDQMGSWFKGRNQHYVTRLELSFLRALEHSESTNRSSYWFDEKHESINEDPEEMKKLDGYIFPHFYGELTKTPKGCEILQQQGHLNQFSSYLHQHRDEEIDPQIIFQLKANLWALGHIGASEVGITLLAKADIIEDIVWIAENSSVFSLKGTAVYVLGLIASTELGDEVLQEAGWASIYCDFHLPYKTKNGLVKKWMQVDIWKYSSNLQQPTNPVSYENVENEILSAIGNLSNNILANTASRVLVRIKGLHPYHFRRADLFYEAVNLLNSYHFRLSARQFVLELFEVPLNPETFDTFSIIRKRLQLPPIAPSPINPRHDLSNTDPNAANLQPETFMESFIDGNYSPVNEDPKRLSRTSITIDKVASEPLVVIRGFNPSS